MVLQSTGKSWSLVVGRNYQFILILNDRLFTKYGTVAIFDHEQSTILY